MARPTILTHDMIDQANQYLGSDENKKGVLTIEGLALKLDISRDTIYEWEKWEVPTVTEKTADGTVTKPNVDQDTIDLHTEFSDIVTRVREKQAEKLIQNGLDGSFNPVITKLLLSKHGYIERSDLTSGDKPLKAALVEFVGPSGTDEPPNEG